MMKFHYRESSHASSSHEVSLEPTTKRREDLGKHSVYTHFPQDRNCKICKRTKIRRSPCRRRNGGTVPCAEKFGDFITTDHKVLGDNCESRNNHRYAVVVQDCWRSHHASIMSGGRSLDLECLGQTCLMPETCFDFLQ